jgi:hypothetical protein
MPYNSYTVSHIKKEHKKNTPKNMQHDITLLLFVTHVDILYLVPTQPPTPLKGHFDPMDEKKVANSILM